MQYLHTMIRVTNIEASLRFYCDLLGLVKTSQFDSEKGRFSLIFLAAPEDEALAKERSAPLLELTHNWDPQEEYTTGRAFGHLAFRVDDIYSICEKLHTNGVTINRPPRDGHMAFVKSPDNISIELLQKGDSLSPSEPWASMENTGAW